MALVNPNIAMSFRQPEFQVPNALAQYGQVAAIQNAQNQNQLAQFQMAAAKRAEEATAVQNELMAKHFDPAKGGVNMSALVAEAAQRGQGGIIPGLLKTETERQSAAAALKKTEGDIAKNEFDLQQKKFSKAWQSAGAASTPQIAIEQLTKAVKNGEIDMVTATREIQNLKNMPPEQYRDWRANKILALMDAKDQLGFILPKNVRQDAGGTILTIQDNPMMEGYGLPVQGMAPIKKTPTIAESTAQGQLAVAQNRLANEQDPNVVARQVVGDDGTVTNYNKFGQVIGTQKGVGKKSATYAKTEAQKATMAKDLDTAISELEKVTQKGGLIDQSTGSYLGKAVDIGARVFGQAMPGDIAAGQLAPIADLALKMVPRFEGPQSNADTTSYKQAAGQLADSTLPAEIRKAAGKEVLRLMKARKNQFVTSDMASGNTAVPTSVAPPEGFVPD